MYDGDFKVLAWLPFPSDVLPAPLLKAWCVTAKALPDISAISALIAVKHGSYSSLYTASRPGTHQKIIDMAMNGVGCRASARHMGVGLTVLRHVKLRPQSVNSRIQPGSDVIVCAEMDEQWVTSALNHASVGCFTRMTGYGGRLWRTSSVNALWPHWSVL